MFVMKPITVGMMAVLVGFCGEAFAGGLSFSQNGAAASGKASAFAGEANDPSALFFNPAGITQLPGTQLMVGTAIIKLNSTFRSSTTAEETDLQDQLVLAPHVYLTHRFKGWDERVSVGLGIVHPFGLVIDWPDNWQGRFATTNARLRVTVFNPTVAFQATPKLSVAAGIQVADIGAEFQQKFDAGNGESLARIHGLTAHPIGWNAGLLYHLTETTSAGLQFRSEMQAKLDGDANFTGPASALFANTRFHTSLKLPPVLSLGVSTKVIPRWTINADIDWQGWRTVGTIRKDFETTATSPLPQSLLNSPGTRLWENSFVYRVGAEYAATDRLALRGGYFYDETPIPDNTFNPTVPNANLHAITFGVGYKWPRAAVDVAYVLGFYEKRTIDGSTIDPDNKGGSLGLGPTAFGSYSTMPHVLVVSLSFKF
jgi:long-chain fatty acid transport protein